MLCKKCGTENPEGNGFCSNCGKRLVSNNKINLKIIGLICIILILVLSVGYFFINKKPKHQQSGKQLIMEEQIKGAQALKCLYEGNYVPDISHLKIFSVNYSDKLNLVLIGCKINEEVRYCLYNCNDSTFTYGYNKVATECPDLLKNENAFSYPEIQFMTDYYKSQTNSNSFYKLVTDSISNNMEKLKLVYGEVNQIFSDYYTVPKALSTFLAKYYNNDFVGNYVDSKHNHQRIQKEMNFIEDKSNISDLLELYSTYNEFYNSVMSYPTGYSYATYSSAMLEKYNQCYKILSKVQQLYN